MKDFPVMNVLQTEADLSEPLEHLALSESPPSLLLYPVLQVTAYKNNI
jgi:hypothetical protein